MRTCVACMHTSRSSPKARAVTLLSQMHFWAVEKFPIFGTGKVARRCCKLSSRENEMGSRLQTASLSSSLSTSYGHESTSPHSKSRSESFSLS